jgi:hypothetical protein
MLASFETDVAKPIVNAIKNTAPPTAPIDAKVKVCATLAPQWGQETADLLIEFPQSLQSLRLVMSDCSACFSAQSRSLQYG